jgi:hypothetical protein
MQAIIIFVATTIALFWDEALITIIGVLTQRKFSAKFLMIWVVVSGLLAGALISLHVPVEYRGITVIMVGFAILFNIQSRNSVRKTS